MKANVANWNAVCIQNETDTISKQDLHAACRMYPYVSQKAQRRKLCWDMFPVVVWTAQYTCREYIMQWCTYCCENREMKEGKAPWYLAVGIDIGDGSDLNMTKMMLKKTNEESEVNRCLPGHQPMIIEPMFCTIISWWGRRVYIGQQQIWTCSDNFYYFMGYIIFFVGTLVNLWDK